MRVPTRDDVVHPIEPRNDRMNSSRSFCTKLDGSNTKRRTSISISRDDPGRALPAAPRGGHGRLQSARKLRFDGHALQELVFYAKDVMIVVDDFAPTGHNDSELGSVAASHADSRLSRCRMIARPELRSPISTAIIGMEGASLLSRRAGLGGQLSTGPGAGGRRK